MAHHPDLADIATDSESRARRLRAFRGRVEEDDDQMVAIWRTRSAAEHASAGAGLSDMAARVAEQTGLGKDPRLTFPGLSALLRARADGGT